MIFTFLLQNSHKRYMFYAEDRESAFIEIKIRLGEDAKNWSLIAFCDVKMFSINLD